MEPTRGDVESVDFADPDPAANERSGPFGRTPAPDERVAIRLHEHPCTYIVRVVTSSKSGPTITELTVRADDGHPVDHAAVRSIPVRRLAHSAAGWIARSGGQVGFVGDYSETLTRPELADSRLAELPWRIEQAIMDGLPVRPTLAADLNISTATLDRMIAKAKAEGLLDGIEIPRRPSPQQRDRLIAEHLLADWLGEHGPDAEMPPAMSARLRKLRGDPEDTTDPQTTATDRKGRR